MKSAKIFKLWPTLLFLKLTILCWVLIGCGNPEKAQDPVAEGALETELLKNINLTSTFVLPDTTTVVDEQGNSLRFKSIAEKEAKLIFRFSWSHCETCVVAQLQFLEKSLNDDEKNRTYVLSSFNSIKDMLEFKKKEKSSLRFVNITLSSLSDRILENENRPYYFVLDNSGKSKFVLFPNGSKTEMVKHYLTIFENLYPASI